MTEPWAIRSTAPGVIRAENFNDWSQTRVNSYSKVGDGRGPGFPTLDPSMPAPGSTTSLRVTYPRSIEDPTACGHPSWSGTFYLPFTDDGTVQFGANSEFYVQGMVRFNTDWTYFTPQQPTWARQWPQKIAGIDYGDPFDLRQSCGDGEIVLTNGSYGFPFGYHSCGIKDQNIGGGYQGFDVQHPVNGIVYQNAMPAPSCRYPDLAGCMFIESDQWLAYTMHVKLSRWYRFRDQFYTRNHVFELWWGRPGQPLTKVISRLDYDYTWEIGNQIPWDSPQRAGTQVRIAASSGQTVFPFGFRAFGDSGNIIVRNPTANGGIHQLPPITFGPLVSGQPNLDQGGIPRFIEGTDYTVSLNANGIGGTVTFLSGRPNGQVIEITRLMCYGKFIGIFAYDNLHLANAGGSPLFPLRCATPHPRLDAWYGPMIISRQPIADPALENVPTTPRRRINTVAVTLS